jgi:hypothetical protein
MIRNALLFIFLSILLLAGGAGLFMSFLGIVRHNSDMGFWSFIIAFVTLTGFGIVLSETDFD